MKFKGVSEDMLHYVRSLHVDMLNLWTYRILYKMFADRGVQRFVFIYHCVEKQIHECC